MTAVPAFPSPTLWVLIVSFVVLSIVYYWWRGKIVVTFAREFTAVRAVAASKIRRVPVEANHPTLVQLSSYYDAFTRDLEAVGFRVVGNLEEYYLDGKPAGVGRWFVAGDGAASGWVGAVLTKKGPRRASAIYTEFTPTHYLATNWGGANVELMRPPSMERLYFKDSVPFSTAIAAHRDAVARRGAAGVTHVDSLDDATAGLDRMMAHANAWRASVPADQLLDEDLRLVLGRHYREYGPLVKKHLAKTA